MRVLCPSCQQLVTLPDSSAGQSTPCPLCGKAFAPPALTGAGIDAIPPSSPAIVAPPTRPAETIRIPDASVVRPTPAGTPTASTSIAGERCCTCTLHKDAVRWIAPTAFFLSFILAFFTWLAAAPNGTPVITQSGWQAMRGAFSVDVIGEEVLQKEDALNRTSGVNWWLLVYVIVLTVVTILAIGSLVADMANLAVPDIFKSFWPHRNVLVAGLGGLLLISLIAPMLSGFGLETAAAAAAEQAVPPLLAKADGSPPTTKELQIRDLKRDMAVNNFAIRRTRWLCLVFFVDLIAVVGAGTLVWLDQRGKRPEPRAEFYC
jgi:hypothetical protein